MAGTEIAAATEIVKAAKPWLDAGSFLLAAVAMVLSIYSTMVARSARWRLAITEPEDGEVHQERASVSGIGAHPSWRVLILHRTDRWYLQEGAATPNRQGNWIHERCHFRAVNKDRTVVALAVPAGAVEKLRVVFGGWGPEGNQNQIKSWDELVRLLNGMRVRGFRVRYRLSDYRRIRRVPPTAAPVPAQRPIPCPTVSSRGSATAGPSA